MNSTFTPKLIVISGPSGSGKTTLATEIQELFPEYLKRAVSATTRPAREGEIHGKEYYFLDEETFQAQIDSGGFLEHAIYNGCKYGTLSKEVYRLLRKGMSVILTIDVQGFEILKGKLPPNDLISIFVEVPDYMLRQRLEKREGITEDQIEMWMENARRDSIKSPKFEFILDNRRELEVSVQQLRRLIQSKKALPLRPQDQAEIIEQVIRKNSELELARRRIKDLELLISAGEKEIALLQSCCPHPESTELFVNDVYNMKTIRVCTSCRSRC